METERLIGQEEQGKWYKIQVALTDTLKLSVTFAFLNKKCHRFQIQSYAYIGVYVNVIDRQTTDRNFK